MRKIEEMLNRHSESSSYNNMINLDVQNLIKEAYNLGLQDAVDNVKTKTINKGTISELEIINKESILKLKL